MARLIGVALFCVGLTACESGGGRLSLRLEPDSDAAAYRSVELDGLDGTTLAMLDEANLGETEWASFFAVYTVESEDSHLDLPPVAGAYVVDPPVVRFNARYPFVPGLRYRVRFDPDMLETRLGKGDAVGVAGLDTVFTLPVAVSSSRVPATSVAAVYPSGDRLPANQLKFYVHFSAPMAEGLAYAHIRLVDERTNEPVPVPFVEVQPELWDPERRRFTLLFNPGRVKRGVGPNLELGPPVRPGRTYRLEINRAWLDAGGRPLREDYTKTFQAIEADRTALNAASWEIETPPAGSRHPVVVNFGEPLDHALLMRVFNVLGRDGTPLSGVVGTSDEERTWRFTPVESWRSGRYELRVETILEDLAGNTLRGPFDVDLSDAEPSEIREAERFRTIPFKVD